MLNLLVIFGVTALVFALVIGLMAVGVLMGRREIKGSCGGLGANPGQAGATACSLCSNPDAVCRELARPEQAADVDRDVVAAADDCDRLCDSNGCSQAKIEACNRE